ncbi:30S ribosomal protein S5 [Amygdalobacter indicium]|jgi:hypothetical protein|uniref:Small ribosomal subunit protein uS5 n=1 Tax=Amygdalobacter indicium TaxID=3029272 RepID=A0ABY8C5F6_9FIRM|nr:30S ribosomal protein S5 [Amygdalobacter indicium]WEG34244.1 30S ribosomal protein S5 [Amygdalobacter indicium]WEG35826.1 30S ribosomal protein S5 [Amygdalobacter indicium]
MNNNYNDPNGLELEERVIHIGRVSKTVKGGRNFRFAALVVVGDRKGNVGVGSGKAHEVPDAIRKGVESAKHNLMAVPLDGTTLPHEYVGDFGAAKVLLKPAVQGTGIIAGGAVRAILELAGVQDVTAKCLGTNNPNNVVNATIVALKAMRSAEEIAKKRGKSVSEIH